MTTKNKGVGCTLGALSIFIVSSVSAQGIFACTASAGSDAVKEF